MGIISDLKALDRNARAVLACEPLFGIPMSFCLAYGTLYRAELGLSSEQIGLLASIGAAANTLCSFAAGALCDRLGRRLAGTIFGLLGFALPHLIYAMSHSFSGFLVGALIGGMWTIEATAWQCMVVEDTPAKDRVNLYRWVNVFVTISGLFTPIAGVMVARHGLVAAARGFYYFAAVAMTLMFILRHLSTRETNVGMERIKETKSHTAKDSLIDMAQAAAMMASNPSILALFLAQQAISFQAASAGVYLGLYAKEALGVGASWVAAIPFLTSAVTLSSYLFLIPRLNHCEQRKNLGTGLLIYISGAVLLALCPRGFFSLLGVSVILTALGQAVIQPFMSAVWTNVIPDEKRAKVISLTWILGSLICMPAGFVAGRLYTAQPRAPFVMSIALYIFALVLTLVAFRSMRQADPRGSACRNIEM